MIMVIRSLVVTSLLLVLQCKNVALAFTAAVVGGPSSTTTAITITTLPSCASLSSTTSCIAKDTSFNHNRSGKAIVNKNTCSRQQSYTTLAAAASTIETEAGASTQAADPTTAKEDHDILLRVARGEQVERTPVWLMRQAGRYMADFRKFSDKIPFRQRSETPEIAVELSLQCWRKFGMDGVIMFSDILTPLPAMGIDFDVVKGKGPVIPKPIRTAEDITNMRILQGGGIDSLLPFVGTTLKELRKETEGKSTLLGFVGSPWTLAAYAVEGGSSRNCLHTKRMMMEDPDLFATLMDKLALSLGEYACYQIEMGAQVIQFFESWAHHLTPSQFERFAKPYVNKAMAYVKARHPDTPVIFFANGGSSYLELQRDMAADMISIDQYIDMAKARKELGPEVLVSGNVDPLVLVGPSAGIVNAVEECIVKAGGKGLILNLGHGVIQETPEDAVGVFVDACKRFRMP